MIELVGVIQATDECNKRSEISGKGGNVPVSKEIAPQWVLVVIDRDAKDLLCQRLWPTEINEHVVGIGLGDGKTLLGQIVLYGLLLVRCGAELLGKRIDREKLMITRRGWIIQVLQQTRELSLITQCQTHTHLQGALRVRVAAQKLTHTDQWRKTTNIGKGHCSCRMCRRHEATRKK